MNLPTGWVALQVPTFAEKFFIQSGNSKENNELLVILLYFQARHLQVVAMAPWNQIMKQG